MMTMEQATEDATADHRFYGRVTLVNVRNAYQGMVKVRLADGSVKPALLGDMALAA